MHFSPTGPGQKRVERKVLAHMTFIAVFLVLRIERLLPVMAFPAEVAPVDPAHVQLVRTLGPSGIFDSDTQCT